MRLRIDWASLHSWKEIYVSDLQKVFTETCLEDVAFYNAAMHVHCLYRPRKSTTRVKGNYANSNKL